MIVMAPKMNVAMRSYWNPGFSSRTNAKPIDSGWEIADLKMNVIERHFTSQGNRSEKGNGPIVTPACLATATSRGPRIHD